MRTLPDFSNPPVVEVALAVTIRPIDGLGAINLARLWSTKFARAFPNVEEHPPVVPAPATPAGGLPGTVSLELLSEAPAPRLWFLNPSGNELVQVQNNWFARNWRRGEDAAYPRYPALRQPFRRDLRRFEGFIDRNQLGAVVPIAAEISYFNHIDLSGGLTPADVLSIVDGDAALRNPDYLQLTLRYPIVRARSLVGGVQVTAERAQRRTDGKPIIALTLTARGAPIGDGPAGLMRFLDLGHERVVRLFAALTRESMHATWGRTT